MKKRRSRELNSHRRVQTNAQVLRQEDLCYLCGKFVDKSLKTPHPMSPEVDHVVPLARGGHPYARANKRLTHRSCNRRKSDKLAAPITNQIPISQDW